MMYLLKSDFQHLVKDAVLDQVVQNNDALLAQCELAVVEQVQSYLRHRYDVANIFNRTGQDRHQWLLSVCVDIMLYHLHSRIAPRQIPDLREDRYNAAIDWLKAVSAGKLSPNFPELDNNKEQGQTIYQGDKKRANRY